MSEVTQLLYEMREGNTAQRNQLFDAVYHELRAIAAHKMASERPNHTLQPTALVNEAYLRLAKTGGKPWENRAHFFGAAAEAMRRILVDSARRHHQLKRGGEREQVEFSDSILAAPDTPERLLLVNDALDTLAREDTLKAEIVKLRYFVGLNHLEIAQALDVNEKTIRRHWEMAKIRLYELISDAPAGTDGRPNS